jgi:hypothetical protein
VTRDELFHDFHSQGSCSLFANLVKQPQSPNPHHSRCAADNMKAIHTITIALLSCLMQVASCLPAQVLNATFADLAKRQCVRAGDENNYQCDEKLPKLSEIVARIRDTSDYGLADDQHVAVFWTNLGDSAQMGTAMSITEIFWMQGWLESRRLRWYWWFEHINLNCK